MKPALCRLVVLLALSLLAAFALPASAQGDRRCDRDARALATLEIHRSRPLIAARLAKPSPIRMRGGSSLANLLSRIRGPRPTPPADATGSAGPSDRIERLSRLIADRCVALNQVQVLGSHNSYHIQPLPELIDLYVMFDPAAIAWEYTHRPLDEQLEVLGIRQFELDVSADPDGGLYSEPFGLSVVEGEGARIPALDVPGTKVLHVPELDWDTTCGVLVDCLAIIRGWSDANPGHLPIFVLIEAKDDPIPDPLDLGFVVPIPFGADEFDRLDEEIRSVFPPSQLLTPDDVRGNFTTLESAVLTRGWPKLGEARGRVLFGLDNGGSKRATYRQGRPSLEGRVLFTDGVPGEEDGAFIKVNGPEGNVALIQDLVREGYIVRTRADADTEQARSGDPSRREAALASGAQFVSTDYAEPNLLFSDYQVSIPGGRPGRCNPINAPAGCRDGALER